MKKDADKKVVIKPGDRVQSIHNPHVQGIVISPEDTQYAQIIQYPRPHAPTEKNNG